MTNNTQDNGKNTPSSAGLFGGGLFNTGNTGSALFGGSTPGNSLFGKTNSPTPGLFSNLGQSPANSLFPATSPSAPQPTNTEANKGTSLFGGTGSTPSLFQNIPKAQPQNPQGPKLDQNSNASNPLGFGSQNSQNKSIGLFGQSLGGSTEKNLAQTTGPSVTSSLFGGNSSKLSFGTVKQEKKEEGGEKKQEKKMAPLFGGMSAQHTSSLFGNRQGNNLFSSTAGNSAGEQKKEAPKAQSTMIGSLFGNTTSNASAELKQAIAPKQPEGSLFGNLTSSTIQPISTPKPQEITKPTEVKPTVSSPPGPSEDKAKPALTGSLFGGNNVGSLFGSSGSANSGFFGGATPASSGSSASPNSGNLFGGAGNLPTPKQPVAAPKTSLFGNLTSSISPKLPNGETVPQTNAQTTQKQTLTLQKVAENKEEPKKTANEPSLFQNKPMTVSFDAKTEIKNQKPKIDQAMPAQQKKQPSLFSNNLSTSLPKPKPEGELQNKTEPAPKTFESFKSFTDKPQTQVNMGLSAESQPPRFGGGLTTESQPSSVGTSKPTEQRHQDLSKQTKPTENESKRTYSFLKPKEINTTQIIDFKTLKNEEKGETFSNFLTQSKAKIISSVKMYFTVRTEPFKSRQHTGDSQVEWFLTDLTNLIIKNLGLLDQSWPLMNQFIRRLINEQKYERFLFRQGKLNTDYFKNQMIYIVDYNQKYYLNEMSSKELQLFIEKIVNRWNVEKVGLLNFLYNCPDLFYKPSDLFYYMFKHLLESQKKLIETPNQNYRVFITDFETVSKKKLVELITFYNAKLKNFGMITSNEELKTLISLIQNSKDESVNEISLKIMLNSINFKQHKEVSPDILDKIKQTKSFVLMPLRALVHRLSTKKHEFVPSPKDLYKYIRGDEWIDWFDIYLSDSSREGLELQVNEPEQILESLCTISGSLILERMQHTKKGIFKFFELLRNENMVGLYYRLLEVCIFDEKSIGEVDEFYFKKMHFNIEYQQVIEYIISFNEHEKHTNEQGILNLLEVKMSLLVKILEVSPQKLVELERYLFNRDASRLKKFKLNEVADEKSRREGEKIIHLFLDTINITSLKGLSNKILHKIFRVISHLLKNQQTEKIVLSALKINRPSFNFMHNALHPLTLNALNEFLQRILETNYLHDLIFSYTQNKEEEIRMEVFYPFRYKDAEYNHMLKYEHTQSNDNQGTFSIYWLNQIIKILGKQRFNPYLVYKILEKFYLVPYDSSYQQCNNQATTVLYQKSKQLDSKIPTIFENIISSINQLTIWQEITRILQFKIIKRESKLDLTNKFILANGSKENFKCLLFTLKLIRMIFRLSDLLYKHQETSSNHFIVKTLSAINFLSKSKINSLFASNASKNNILLSIIANLQFQQDYVADNYRGITWQAEHTEDGQVIYHALITYVNSNKNNLDFEQANNFLKRPNTDLYEAENSIISVSLDLLVEIIKLSPECSIEYTLTVFLPLKEDEKQELKTEIINKLVSTLSNYIDDAQVGAKIMEFIFNLKHNCGFNKLHTSLATRLFDEFIKINKRKERSPKFNAILCKYLLKELDEGNLNYESFTEQFVQEIITNFKFKDSFLNNFYEFKDTRQIGRMIKSYHQKPYSFFNLNQIERIIQERAIVEIGFQFEYLKTIVQILLIQIIRRKHSQSLINCIYLFNTLLLNNNMILLDKDLPNQFKTSKLSSQFEYNQSEPRLYIRDPLQLYISETRNSKKKYQVQTHQKNNIIEWILDKCHLLSDKITNYIKFVLTINKYLYSNNPISFSVERSDIASLELFSHLSLGKMNFTAIELFGKSSSDSIDAVQGIASNLINRLIEIRKSSDYNSYEDQSYKQGLKILGFCLEWLRGKERYGENASHYLIRKIQKNYLFLLPENNNYLSAESIKVLLSTLSMGDKYFSNDAKAHIHETIYGLIEKYWLLMQKGYIEEQARSLGELVQQALAILLIIPPEKNETDIFELLVNIWVKEKNFQFFFNESRLILELTTIYPEQIVKLQPLTRCEIVSNLSNIYNRYDEDNERKFDSIAWTWVVKIATELVNHPLSILVISQVSTFFKQYKDRFINLFELNDKLSKSYVEDLQAALELMACLFSHDLWINFNRKMAEELTYLLSHKLIKVFVSYAQGKLAFFVGSNNDRNLSLVKCSGTIQEQFAENFDNMTQDNMFITELKIKMNHCVRNYCILMEKAFKSSHYVEKYFDSPVYENFKYFSSFWDIFNKNIIALFVYSNKQFKVWNSVKKLNDTLNTLNECYNSPHTFVENGYLSTIIELPKNEFQLFSDIYLLNYLISELAVIHYLKEKLYVNKFNNLLANHIETFSKKIKEHVDNVKIECKKINVAMNLYIKEEEFNNILEIIDANKNGK